MRHLRSILYALVLAPATWVLTGVAFTDDLHGRARQYSGVESFTGLLVLLLAGATYAILVFAPISPAGPALFGLVFLGAGLWALNSPSSYDDLWPAGVTKRGFDLSRPGYGLAVLLAVPLICTALSARRWERYEPPQLPLIGTVGRPRGAAAAPGTPVGSMTTQIMQQPAEAAMPPGDATQVLPPMTGNLSDERTAVMIFVDEPTAAVISPDEPTAAVISPDEPTAAVVSASDDEPTVVGASGEATVVTGLEERPVADDVVEDAAVDYEPAVDAPSEETTTDVRGEGPTADVAGKNPEPGNAGSADESDDATAVVTEPVTEDVSAKVAATDEEPTQITAPVAEGPAEAEADGGSDASEDTGAEPTEVVTATAAEPTADEREEAAESTRPEAIAQPEALAEPDGIAAPDEVAEPAEHAEPDEHEPAGVDSEPARAEAVEPEPAEHRPVGENTTAIETDDQDKTQIIRLPVSELPTRNFLVTPGERTQVISRDRMEETQVIRIPQQRTDSSDGERTQIIRLGTGTVDPPGDRTQVIRIPTEDTLAAAEPAKDPEPPSRPPSIVAQERPDPGADPTTRLVQPSMTDPGEETTVSVGNGKRAMTVMNLERPADEVADDTRPLILPKREDQTT